MYNSYEESGVSIERGDQFVHSIKEKINNNLSDRVVKNFGQFAGLIKNGKGHYLALTCDGVGTKLILAKQCEIYNTIGIDLVAMNVNDLLCVGARPVAFLDYMAFEKLDDLVAQEIVEGILEGCRESQCSLIGGETAEMPGLYNPRDFDLAGFCMGEAREEDLIRPIEIVEGDLIIGLESSGFHSNGLSLVRKFIKNDEFELMKKVLTPTKIYVNTIESLKKNIKIKGLAHITGGGIHNISRINEKFNYELDYSNVPLPDFMSEIIARAKLPEAELYKTWNMGIGMVLIISKEDEEQAYSHLRKLGENAYLLGEVKIGSGKVSLKE